MAGEGDFGLMFTLNTLLILVIEVPLNSATARWPHNRVAFMLGPAVGSVGLERLGSVAFWSGALGVGLLAGLLMLALPGRAHDSD